MKKTSNSPPSSLTRSSSTNFTPLPVSQSRLPVPRSLKRASSPDYGSGSVDYENFLENLGSSQPQTATPSPSKQGKISEIVKQRLYSLTPSPLKVRSAAIGGIFLPPQLPNQPGDFLSVSVTAAVADSIPTEFVQI